ncbi:hypothetical protein QBC34DRAFT_497555 [Podospora aff. communis PSN243]|uniref:Clr5 domain-containing protein n=1 Tax=Podospora aff. communis PSN243 TaxID=3040156 RepID=A0AAV9GBA3_9PEZI|nr:hypothetical protein QBC34DRAFT_497555 [Podospora aff. communis PSN243]
MAAPVHVRGFQFATAPVAPRTGRIPAEIWEKHKVEITRIYLELNVGEVAVQMQLRHNFQASVRQYIYQLRKWGVKKQGPGALAGAPSTWPEVESLLDSGQENAGKRRRSAADNSSPSGSADCALSEPPKKKMQREQHPDLSMPPLTGFRHDEETHLQTANIPRDPPAQAISPADPSPHPDVERYPPEIIDRNRPIETFSHREMAAISRAADFFAALDCNHEAFELYIMVLKRRCWEIKNKKPYGFRLKYILWQCASTVSNTEHAGVIRKILELELYRTERGQPRRDSPSKILAFLSHMLLVFVCQRSWDLDGVTRHITEARAHVPDDNLFEHGSDGALDLALYLSVLRWRAADLGSLTLSPSRLFDLEPKPMASLENYVLSHVPGPFQMQGNKALVNPCIRACLMWCSEKIMRLRLLPAHDKPKGPHAPIAFCKRRIIRNESETLFIMLWRQWRPDLHGDAPTWIRDSQNTTGITPTEMLLVVSHMICADSMGLADNSMIDGYHNWTHSLGRSAMDLLRASDMELGRMFLREYVSKNTITSPLDLYDHTRCRRNKTINLMEDTLGVTIGNINTSSADLRRSTLQLYSAIFAFPGNSTHPSPTLASSLSSPDWSDFKSTGNRAAQRLIRFARGSPPFLSLSPSIPSCSPPAPSGLLRRTSGTPDSMISISASLKALSVSSGSH